MRTGERIAERRNVLGLSQTQLAKMAGLSQATIGKLEAGISSGSSHLHKIARVLQTTPAYLAGETDDPGADYVPVPSTEAVAEELGLVAVRELDLTLGMGSTYLDVPVTETVRHFPREWLRLYTNAAPEHLVFAIGAGDSMEPTLRDSDMLLIDCSQQTLNMSDKIWAVTWSDCGAVKRLRPVPGGGVAVLSDNPNVPDAVAHDGELHLLGRVVAVIRKM